VCGHVKLADLKPAHVQACVRAMSAGTRVPASPASVHLRFRVLKAALSDAVRTDRITVSPARGIDLPRIRKTTVSAPTPEQVATILGAAVPPYDVPLAVLAWTGLRRGEALALTWADDIDLEKRQLHVRRALTYDGKTVAFSEPKSDSAKRTVPLADPIVAVLRAHRAAQAERRLQVGTGWVDLGLVVDNGDGGFMHPGRLSHYYGDLTDGLGIDTRLHDLRHAAITQMVAAGVDLAKVAAVAGHSNLSFTIAQYAHLRPEHLREAADAMDKAYGGGS
jgi:integrase